ncbi:MAG: hypothetical protein SH850_14200 [Planctomycetaceae bacterium]|nr:hypothetical protein [Planctomycetaceae bacterium]
MRQLLLVLSMLTSFVVCPFDCMGRMTTGDAVGLSAGGCRCCSQCGTDSDDPSAPTSDGQRCDCICNGALLTDSVSISADGSMAWSVDAVIAAAPVALGLAAARQESQNAADRMRPGRSLHLALHSLQV